MQFYFYGQSHLDQGKLSAFILIETAYHHEFLALQIQAIQIPLGRICMILLYQYLIVFFLPGFPCFYFLKFGELHLDDHSHIGYTENRKAGLLIRILQLI